jgi:hypothetical protein
MADFSKFNPFPAANFNAFFVKHTYATDFDSFVASALHLW